MKNKKRELNVSRQLCYLGNHYFQDVISVLQLSTHFPFVMCYNFQAILYITDIIVLYVLESLFLVDMDHLLLIFNVDIKLLKVILPTDDLVTHCQLRICFVPLTHFLQ